MEHREILNILLDRVAKATEASRLANEQFQIVIKDILNRLPHPDGVQRIHNVSNENAVARKNLQEERARLVQFRAYGHIPPDLREQRKTPQSETNLSPNAKDNASSK